MANLAKLILVMCLVGASHSQIRRDFNFPTVDSFNVYWNVPTYLCQKFNIDFEPHLQKFGIIGNRNDAFRGEQILILYDPALFPAMIKDKATGQLTQRNGGIPQQGNLNAHLDEFASVIERVVPRDFRGVGIIDFEAWRPVFRQNWNDQVVYKNMSLNLERRRHPNWSNKQIVQAARENFGTAARAFMHDTLKVAKNLRPNARWGYYGFPYCFNKGKDGSVQCSSLVQKENNGIQWMFDESTALYPSVYSNSRLTTDEHRLFVIGRLNEAWRMASRASRSQFPHVYPYIWYRYNDVQMFLPRDKMFNALEMTRRYRMGGAIIWGSSFDLNTQEKCQSLWEYVNNVLGPIVLRVKQNRDASVKNDGIITERVQEHEEPVDEDEDGEEYVDDEVGLLTFAD